MEKPHGWAIWLTGLPASGKAALAQALRRKLSEHGVATIGLPVQNDFARIVVAAALGSDDFDIDFAAVMLLGRDGHVLVVGQ